MPDPSDTANQSVTTDDARRAGRDAGVGRPETDPGAAPPGRRAYEDLPVQGTAQGPLSPGASEPGDMGEPNEGDREERPHEHPRDDRSGYRG